MPKVIITEKDFTGAEAAQYDDYIVLIPGTRTLTTLESGEVEAYFTSAEKFREALSPVDSGDEFWDVPTKMAYRLLQLGMTVLYRVIDSVTVLDNEEEEKFWTPYEDKGLYNLRFLTTGGYGSQASAEAMIHTAAVRGDAIALIDFPAIGSTIDIDDEQVTFNGSAAQCKAYVESLNVDPVLRVETNTLENAFKYAAAFAPTVSFKEAKELKIDEEYPGSFAYLSCFAYHTANFKDWFAMAGSTRGVLPYEKVAVANRYGQADIDLLQDRVTKDAKAVNVITEIRPYGNIVWGNRTLYPITENTETETIGLRASNFLNVRNLCCDIKKTLYRAARKFTFEPNSDALWINFKGAITPLLEEMRAGQGIRGYKIIKKTTSEKATLKAVVKIIPIEAVEDFDLTVELTDSISVTE